MASFEFPDQFFVSGTDTGIGKTVVSAILTKGLNATYWKPVQSGLEEMTDTEVVRELTQLPGDYFIPETYRLTEPMSPHASAAIDGVEIDMNNFRLPDASPLVVEGAGGLIVPLNEDSLVIDLIEQLELPVLLVARSGLGTLNHTLLSIEALRRRDIPILGVVMNGPIHDSNRKAIEHYGEVEIIAEIEPLDELTPETIERTFEEKFSL